MSFVVAILDQNTAKTFLYEADVPKGAMVFHSPKELSAILTNTSMDKMRERLLGEIVEPSPSREMAGVRLWHVLAIGADFDRVDWSSGGYTTRKDNFGNKKIADVSPIELIQLVWTKGKDSIVDHFYRKLAKQARQMVDMLVDDGRRLWTNEQANAVILAREAEIETKQGALIVFNYYKSHLFQKKILRRVSYVEFASRPEFAAMAIQDKE